jgi:hypothetical protein
MKKLQTTLGILAIMGLLLTSCKKEETKPSEVVLYINEFMASNDTTAFDPDFNDSGDWIEIYNPNDNDVDISGFYLTDDINEPNKWQVPNDVVVPAHGFLVIWADDHDTLGQAPHTNFKLSSSGEQIALYDASGSLIDSITFGEQQTDVSYGRYPDGSDNWIVMYIPTPGEPNTDSVPPQPGRIYINEFMASNDTTIADPDFGDYSDWIELYNDGDLDIDISGYYLTDDLTDTTKWQVPEGVIVPAHGFLLIWADDEDTLGQAPHTNFKLSSGGEQIGLFDPEGTIVDSITFGEQQTDVSYGRYPDGSDNWTFMTPTPGEPNQGGKK